EGFDPERALKKAVLSVDVQVHEGLGGLGSLGCRFWVRWVGRHGRNSYHGTAVRLLGEFGVSRPPGGSRGSEWLISGGRVGCVNLPERCNMTRATSSRLRHIAGFRQIDAA